jgi:hypothetical protein
MLKNTYVNASRGLAIPCDNILKMGVSHCDSWVSSNWHSFFHELFCVEESAVYPIKSAFCRNVELN